MPGRPTKIGPFNGGLNTYSAVTAVEDTQVVDIVNFDIDLDGSLVSRPPIVQKATQPGDIRPLGYFKDPNGNYYLIGAGGGSTYYFDGTNWTAITATIEATCFVQYDNKAWLVAPKSSANPGGYWTFAGGFVAVAAMQKGMTACIYKERMFIGEGSTGATASRIYFSVAADLNTWNAADFLDVSAGDGQSIKEIRVFTDTIVVFKTNSTYIYSYDSSPSRGAVRVISTAIGVADRDCCVEYENSLYILHKKYIYQIQNWNYDRLNTLVPFVFTDTKQANSNQGRCLSVMNDRLVIRYFDKIYVLGLKTRVWTTWSTNFYLHKFYLIPTAPNAAAEFITTSADTTSDFTYSLIDAFSVTRSETISCSFTTKTYQFDTPYGFKKLAWWGVDLLTKSSIKGQVFPISYSAPVSWSTLGGYTWDAIKNNTWARPLDIAINVDSTFSTANIAENRMFLKFLKALRFRQVNFKLSGTYDGTSTTGPYRIYSLVAFVYSKELVTQTVN